MNYIPGTVLSQLSQRDGLVSISADEERAQQWSQQFQVVNGKPGIFNPIKDYSQSWFISLHIRF